MIEIYIAHISKHIKLNLDEAKFYLIMGQALLEEVPKIKDKNELNHAIKEHEHLMKKADWHLTKADILNKWLVHVIERAFRYGQN